MTDKPFLTGAPETEEPDKETGLNRKQNPTSSSGNCSGSGFPEGWTGRLKVRSSTSKGWIKDLSYGAETSVDESMLVCPSERPLPDSSDSESGSGSPTRKPRSK